MSIVRVDSSATFSSSFDVGVSVHLVAFDDVVVGDLVARVRVHLHVLDAVPRVQVDLVEADLLGFRRGRVKGYGTVTSERRRKPFQLARAAMRYSRHCSDSIQDELG